MVEVELASVPLHGKALIEVEGGLLALLLRLLYEELVPPIEGRLLLLACPLDRLDVFHRFAEMLLRLGRSLAQLIDVAPAMLLLRMVLLRLQPHHRLLKIIHTPLLLVVNPWSICRLNLWRHFRDVDLDLLCFLLLYRRVLPRFVGCLTCLPQHRAVLDQRLLETFYLLRLLQPHLFHLVELGLHGSRVRDLRLQHRLQTPVVALCVS
mmetsp:Transcript_35972/g.81631  ORF Transcript_35972/g.81631 Transcript_35972/m.81631 type:complete len:208 (+) Transcript_35972:1200-1823(+)